MNPRFIRFKAKKAKPCFYCRRATKLRVVHERPVGGTYVQMQNTCLCAGCLQAMGMVAQAQKMLNEEDDTLVAVLADPIPPMFSEEEYNPADAIDDVTAEGYRDEPRDEDEFRISAFMESQVMPSRKWTRSTLAAAKSIADQAVSKLNYLTAEVRNTFGGDISDVLYKASK